MPQSKDAPLLGVVPWAETLDQPSVLDLEQMFDTTALAGRKWLLRRYLFTRVIGCSLLHYNVFIICLK